MKTYLVNKTAKTVFAMSGLYRYTVKDRFNGTIGKFWLFYSNPHRKFVALLKLLFLNLRTILFLRAKSTLLKKKFCLDRFDCVSEYWLRYNCIYRFVMSFRFMKRSMIGSYSKKYFAYVETASKLHHFFTFSYNDPV